MPTALFIHGLSNKPESNLPPRAVQAEARVRGRVRLRHQRRRVQPDHWADVLYPTPDTDLAAYESAATGDEMLQEGRDAATLAPDKLPEKGAVHPEDERLARDRRRGLRSRGADRRAARALRYERIPLPAWLRNRLMAKLVRDAHLYFFNRLHAAHRRDVQGARRATQALPRRADSDQSRRPAARGRLAQHGDDDRVRLPDARSVMPSDPGADDSRQPAGPRRGDGFWPEVDAQRRLPVGEAAGALGERLRPARRRLRAPTRSWRTTTGRTGRRSSRICSKATGASGATASASTCREAAAQPARVDAEGELAVSAAGKALLATIGDACKRRAKADANTAIGEVAAAAFERRDGDGRGKDAEGGRRAAMVRSRGAVGRGARRALSGRARPSQTARWRR